MPVAIDRKIGNGQQSYDPGGSVPLAIGSVLDTFLPSFIGKICYVENYSGV